jgi:hypothetical protein
MQFKQYEDGSCEWCFSDKEIELLKKKKKFLLYPAELKSICNDLMRVLTTFQEKFPPKVQTLQTSGEELDLSKE